MAKTIGYAVSAVGMMLIVFVLYVVFNFNALPLDEQVVQQLQLGMSVEDVEALVSEPTAVHDEGTTWVFSRSLSWPIITLHFSDDRTLEEIVIDE